jgi:hypothetical protein
VTRSQSARSWRSRMGGVRQVTWRRRPASSVFAATRLEWILRSLL